MKIYLLPEKIGALILDIDSTLYDSPEYAFEQVDCQIRRFADENSLSHEEARKTIADYRARWAEEHEGKKISLGNALTAFGIPIEKSIEWREQLLEPEKFLVRDENLASALEALSKKFRLACVTNNPVLPARRTLRALGVEHIIGHVIGLDTCKVSKPAREPFMLAARLCGVLPERCVSVGDRFDIDIALPLEMGMGGILVSGVRDVYSLAEML